MTAQHYDEGVELVHRAFCDPEHEMVGEWDKSMADALRRRGYVIVRRGLLERVCRDGEYEQMEAIGQLMEILGLSYDPAQDRMVGWQTVDE